jgi:putative transcriptional regulator
MIRRHPSDDTLLAFAAGKLPEPHRIVLRTHLARCESCAASLRLATDVGGALLDDLPPAAMDPAALERTLARLDLRDAPAPPRVIPATVAELATGRWWWIAPGLRMMPLRARDSDDARLDLLRVAPGVGLPSHGHTGTELSLVLQGGFSDETGAYHEGEVAEGDAGLAHRPRALPGPPCIVLVATSGRLRAHDRLARLIQPLLGL